MKQEYYTERSIDECKHRFRSYINGQQVKHGDIIWVFSERPNKNELIITTYNSEANITDSYTVNNYRQLICMLKTTTTKTKISITFKSRKRFYILPVTACLFYISWSFYHGNIQIAIMVGLLISFFYIVYFSLDRLLRTKKNEEDLLSFMYDLFECENNSIIS